MLRLGHLVVHDVVEDMVKPVVPGVLRCHARPTLNSTWQRTLQAPRDVRDTTQVCCWGTPRSLVDPRPLNNKRAWRRTFVVWGFC